MPADVAASLALFDSAMRQLGYVKGSDYVVLERMAAGREDVLRTMAEDLVARKVDLIFAATTDAVAEASRRRSTIPIVFVSVSNPVLSGFAESLAHPGRNMTGISNITGDLGPKRIELLKQMVLGLARVALLVNPASANYPSSATRLEAFANTVGVRTSILESRTPAEIDAAFARLPEARD